MLGEINATLTKEEAELVFRTPKDNRLVVGPEMKPKVVVFIIKNYLLYHNEVKLEGFGPSISAVCTAAKILADEKVLTIDRIETDLAEEPHYGPKITLIVTKATNR